MSDSQTPRTLVPYPEALAAQQRLVRARQQGRVGDLLWLLEHPPTITWGSSGGEDNLLLPVAGLKRRGVTVCATERGGNVTYHEPGQLVGYSIVRLGPLEEDQDLHSYLRRLEDGLVELLGSFGVEASTVEGRTGVWIPRPRAEKIAAIGVRCSRWVTSHGLALNVENDLRGFQWIVPCGIAEAGVTSLVGELGDRSPPWDLLLRTLHTTLEKSLGRPLQLLHGPEALSLAAEVEP